MVKTLRDMSMAEKRGTGEHTRSVVAQNPCNKVKAALTEPKTPMMERAHSQPRYVRAVLAGQVGTTFASRNLPLPNDGQRDRSRCRNGNLRCARGSPVGREAYSDGVIVVVSDGESPLQGEGSQMSDDLILR